MNTPTSISTISLIVPIYNVALYLSECLDSILGQHYRNLEIILVNDGSTDRSGEICRLYAGTDSRIKVLHQSNGGLSDARNNGLKMATGDFIAFIDADDILSEDFCGTMISYALAHQAEVVECDFKRFENTDELDCTTDRTPTNTEIFAAEEALAMLMKEHIKQMACNKLFRKNVLEGVFFEKGRKHEDEFWTYQIIGNAKKIVKINNVLYYYRRHSESIMGSDYSTSRLDGLDALQQRIVYMREHFPGLESIAVNFFCIGSMWHYQKISKHEEIDPDYIYRKHIVKNLNVYKHHHFIKHWRMKEILWFQFFMAAPNWYATFRNKMRIGI